MPSGLTDNINAPNVVSRFADYVRGAANSGISWGTNAYPFTEFSQYAGIFGGDTNGKPLEISAYNLEGPSKAIISAQSVYNVLIAETTRYTRIRNIRALLFVLGTGGNTGSRPNPGYIYINTAVAHLNSGYQVNVSADRNNVFAGNTMTRAGTAAMFNNMRAAYNNIRAVSAGDFQVNVCHASCHSNCHNSRGRR